jgi:hypothetical protein
MKNFIFNQFIILGISLFLGITVNAQTKKTNAKQPQKVEAKQRKITPALTCPDGLLLINGICAKKVKLNERLVYISCGMGGMQYNEINADGTFGATVKGPQSGQSCDGGNWVHTTEIAN